MLHESTIASADSEKENMNVIMSDIENVCANDNFDDINFDSLDLKNVQITLKKIVNMLTANSVNMNVRFDALEHNINNIIKENNELKSRIEFLESKLDHFDQNNLNDAIDIIGVPLLADENVPDTVCKVLNSIDVKINSDHIKSCKRFNSFRDGAPGKIFVRFKCSDIKNEIFLKKKKKRISSNLIVNKVTPNLIYINESLTTYRRRLLAEARKLKKSEKIKFVWTSNGTVLVKVKEGDKSAIRISCYGDLDKIEQINS